MKRWKNPRRDSLKEKIVIRDVVEKILIEDERARSDLRYLYIEVIKRINPDCLYKPFKEVMEHAIIPNMETVRRSVQLIQEHNINLCPTEMVKEARKAEKQVYREFVRMQ